MFVNLQVALWQGRAALCSVLCGPAWPAAISRDPYSLYRTTWVQDNMDVQTPVLVRNPSQLELVQTACLIFVRCCLLPSWGFSVLEVHCSGLPSRKCPLLPSRPSTLEADGSFCPNSALTPPRRAQAGV